MILRPAGRETERQLEELRLVSGMMKEHHEQIETLMKRRKELILKLKEKHVTYKTMSEYMGTTYQNIYKIIKDELPRDEHGKARVGRPPVKEGKK
jgi:ribosome maturation protein Sdo1